MTLGKWKSVPGGPGHRSSVPSGGCGAHESSQGTASSRKMLENRECRAAACSGPKTPSKHTPECSKLIARPERRRKNRLARFSRLLPPSPPSSGAAKGGRDCLPGTVRSWSRPKITKVKYLLAPALELLQNAPMSAAKWLRGRTVTRKIVWHGFHS